MFAIEINPNTLAKIHEEVKLTEEERRFVVELAVKPANIRWYFVRNYVTRSGKFFGPSSIPRFVIHQKFEYDPIKIKYDWDQIVRKEEK